MCTTATDQEARNRMLQEVKQSSVGGTRLNTRLTVFRGDTRSMAEIRNEGGFVPSTILNAGEDLLQHAKRQANEIMKMEPQDFMHAWKYSMSAPAEIRDLVVGKDGRLAGVSCGILGGQKGGKEYKITVPKPLYVVGKTQYKSFIIAFYGDNPNLEECTILGMHFIQIGNAEEFVFLTKVPMEWIEEC